MLRKPEIQFESAGQVSHMAWAELEINSFVLLVKFASRQLNKDI